jgi:hypothetical protein
MVLKLILALSTSPCSPRIVGMSFPPESLREGLRGDGLFNNTALIGQNRCFHCESSEGMPSAQPLNTLLDDDSIFHIECD